MKYRTLLGLSLAFAAVTAAAEARDLAGSYRLTVGNRPSCDLTLAADGGATVDAACNPLGNVARWKATRTGFELEDNAGTLVAVLKESADAFAGMTAADHRRIVISR